jgi:hypothetical protein
MPTALPSIESELAMNNVVQGFGVQRKAAVLLLMSMLALPLTAAAQSVCGEAEKQAAAKELSAIKDGTPEEKLAAEASVYEKFKFCIQDAQALPATDPFFVAARQCGARVSLLGSTFFEEMSCCGYDPQRRTFGCPVKIKQRFGFGPAPLPGSREFVLNCVADNNGVLQPVGVDSVHLADELFGQPPTWQFAVIANANQNLHTVQPMNGITRRARSILSWAFQPTGCNFQPIWGNALDYRIRLDQ